ncbi:MAG TPA: BlaI/MecI/CopY family transcriptional regulator [Gemmatimonadales bacterium]|jgi:predicted transcriptional regulator|nr:BlaI/MecI/CopY family transcriptional regulator [Gemmatimonadales bacterium]
MPESHQLTELQLALLRVLWQRGEASVADISEALRPERSLAPTTVATLLSRLERRGVVRHRVESRQFIYAATVSEDAVRHSMLSELTEQLFDGDVAELVSHLLSAREISSGDLDKVKELIAHHESRVEVSDESR